jgi:hypothetical protein
MTNLTSRIQRGGKVMHRGNGTPVAGLPVDAGVRGVDVPDPPKPEEVEEHGASGPIAGATLVSEPADADREAPDREARRAPGGSVRG